MFVLRTTSLATQSSQNEKDKGGLAMEKETLEVFIQRLDRLEQAAAEVNLRLSSLGLGGRRGLIALTDCGNKLRIYTRK